MSVVGSVSRGFCLPKERSAILHLVHRRSLFIHCSACSIDASVSGTDGHLCSRGLFCLYSISVFKWQDNEQINLLDPEGSQSATTVVVVGVLVTLFEKCLRLCLYATDSHETSHGHIRDPIPDRPTVSYF